MNVFMPLSITSRAVGTMNGLISGKETYRRILIRQKVMSVLEKAMQDSNSLADKAFIEEALSELENDIVYIEQGHNVMLVGDRADFDKARRDWLHLIKIQVAYAVSYWRAGMFKRYSRK